MNTLNTTSLHHLGRRLAYEQWRDIDGFIGSHQVSDFGRVRSIDRTVIKKDGSKYFAKGKILGQVSSHGYKRVSLKLMGNGRLIMVHRLVAGAFIPNNDKKPQVNHKDGDKQNNHKSNLEWVTASENIKHSYDELGRVCYHKGRTGKDSLTAKAIKCIDTGQIYPSVVDASKDLGIGKTNISKVLSRNNTRNKTAGGMVFEYVNTLGTNPYEI